MNKEVIDALHKRAKTIGIHLGRNWKGWDVKGNDWARFDPQYENLSYTIPTAGTIQFRRKKSEFFDGNPDWTLIEFKDITPVNIVREKIHKPVVIGRDIQDLETTTITNESHNMYVDKTYDYSTNMTRTVDQDIGVSLSVGLQQKIGYSGLVVSGETTISVSATTSYNKSFGSSDSVSRDSQTSIEVPPRTKAIIVNESSVSNFEQKCEYWCDLEHKIRFYSHNDFDYNWDSLSQLKDVLAGYAPADVDAGEFYRDMHREGVIKELRPVEIYFSDKVTFSEAVTGDIKLMSEDLDAS